MSDDELEKLAAAMKDISPSKAARERGMDAAMAAFDAEFASETSVVTEAVEEKISTTTQGLSDAPRPTGQTTYAGYVQTRGRDAMSKVKEFFTAPKAMMMMGTCAAALFATSLYVPNTRFENMPKPAPEAVTAEVSTEDRERTTEVHVKTDMGAAALSDIDVTEPSIVETPERETKPVPPIKPEQRTAKVDKVETPVTSPVIEPPVVGLAEAVVSAPETSITPPAVAAPIFSDSSRVEMATVAEAETPSDTVVITRRVVKTPARIVERAIPNVAKTETRRVLKKPGIPTGRTLPAVTKEVSRRVVRTPAATQERMIPAITKEVTGRVKQDDGSFKTVTATVVLQEASTELVMAPPSYETVTETVVVEPERIEYEPGTAEYETVAETVVVQEASTELVTIPATFETVTETIKIGADGSTTVINSVTTGSPERLAEAPPGNPMPEFAAAPTPAPAPMAMAEVHDEVVVTGGRVKSRSRSGRASAKASGTDGVSTTTSASAPAGKFTVFDGVSERVVESTETIVAETGEILARVMIPAEYKTITKQVLVKPARTVERYVPAVTEDIKVKVLTEDGSYEEVTRTVVVREGYTDIDVIPPVYETRVERILVAPAKDEWKPKPKPQPEPQSGLLTAGDYDDVLNPDLYKVYLDKMLQGPLKRKDLPYVDANNRINIRVVDSAGQPVPLADIAMRTRNNNRMFPLRTGADGMAYLYPEYDGLERGVRLRISVNDGKAVRKTISSTMVRKGGDIDVVLDTQTATKKNLDLLLTIDATGSMGDEMRYLQTELKAIVGRVERANPGIDIRTGLVVYRDVGDDYVVREVPFTDDLEKFREALNAQSAHGGGDMPEAMHTALQTGLDMDWRKDAIKINLLVADAPPHDRHLSKTWEAGLKSRTRGIHVVPLAASGVDKTAEFVMRSMAQITGGRYLFLTDDSGVGNSHAKPTVDCYIVTRLDGLVIRTISSLVKGERVEPQPGEVIRSVGNYRAGTCAIDEEDIPTSIQTVSSKYKQ